MKLRITVDGKTYEVEAEIIEQDQPYRGSLPPVSQASMPVHVSATVPSAPATPITPQPGSAVEDGKAFRSPISGVVVRVSAQVGQTVEAGDELMVVEAMKMETILTALGPGKIAKVNAAAGDSVQVTQTLVEFE